MLAFVPAVAALDERSQLISARIAQAKAESPERPPLPVFKPRWWYSDDRLDARPVIWSLDNHPEEWKLSSLGHCIVHEPSQHQFWIDGHGLQSAAYCSCTNTSKKFQIGQGAGFVDAVERWQAWNTRGQPSVQEQFAAHFIHD